MKFRPTLLALGLGLLAVTTSMATRAGGDSRQGKLLVYTCQGCHGVPNYKNAYPNYSVPRLGGQHANYLALALQGYVTGERSHPTMHAQAISLSDQDRAEVAAYLQGVSRAEPQRAASAAPLGSPPAAIRTCVACHGTNGAKTISEDYPILAGQYADYLEQALNDYKQGKRKNAVMAGIMTQVDEKDFPAIARFFSEQRGLCGSDRIMQTGKCP